MMEYPKPPFMLGSEEKLSSTWNAIKKHLIEQLVLCREKNDSALTVEETATLRGKIAAFKQLLRAGDDPTFE